MTKLLALLLVLVLSFSVLASCGPTEPELPEFEGEILEGDYTYKTWSTALGTNWNPHKWETNADSAILGYLSSPFVSMEALDTEEGIYQWVYSMATSITDVTAGNQADLTKYNVTLPEGKTAEEVTEGYVFEIKLNDKACWENGVKITADDYIYSMQQLLSSKMRNYRANLYISGESAVAGGLGYYNSEAPLYEAVVPAYGADETPDYSLDLSDKDVYINLTTTDMTFSGYSFSEFVTVYGFISQEDYDAVNATANGYGYVKVTEENYDAIVALMDTYCSAFDLTIYNEDGTVNDEFYREFLFYISGVGEKVEYDAVGCYKVDDYTIRYVCQTAIDYNYFLTSCTDTWLVYEELYEAGKSEKGGLTITDYGTSKATSMSYGVYKMQSFEDAKQVVYVQNENWWGWQTTENGYRYSITDFVVDGKVHQQYQTTKIVIDVMTQDVAKTKFLAGELTDYSPTADELSGYALSPRLYKVDETYTMSFFFHTDVDSLTKLDDGANENSVVLSNENFRKAMSLAINRADFVGVTQGWTPAFSLMNHLYHYDIYNDPTSSYRNSDEAMQAIVNLYGVEYGEDKIYKTLEEAHDSITGYNLTEAKALMAQACDELVAAELYTEGEDITIQIGWAKGALTADDNAQVAKINEYVNAALAGSGFGTITFEAIGNINDRYGDTASGLYAIGYGAWGGAAFYPFRNFQVYMDPAQYDINEAGCYDPTTEELTLTVKGEEVTMTWQEWSNSMIGTGAYANEDNKVKLAITAQLEEAFLKTYYRIPLAVTTVCSLLSYQVDEYTQNYNIMYGFGGFRLMSWNYNDAEWAAYVAEQDGELNYN